MLATWCPLKNNRPDLLTVDQAWRCGVTSTQPIPSGADYVDNTFVTMDLKCDKCWLDHALPHIMIGDVNYWMMIHYSNDYVQFEFILSFATWLHILAILSRLCPWNVDPHPRVKYLSSKWLHTRGGNVSLRLTSTPYLMCTRQLTVSSILKISMQ